MVYHVFCFAKYTESLGLADRCHCSSAFVFC